LPPKYISSLLPIYFTSVRMYFMIRFHHLGIVCRDLEKSKDFYLNFLGFKLRNEIEAPASLMKALFDINSKAKISFLISGNIIIELFSFPDEQHKQRMGTLFHFCLTVDTPNEVFAKIKEAGYQTIKEPKADGEHILFVKDPDGVLIELK